MGFAISWHARRSRCPTLSRERSPQQAGLKWPTSSTRKSGAVPSARRGSDDVLDTISTLLAVHGLVLRGGFTFEPHEGAPARSVLLVGNVGGAYWSHFSRWRATQPPDIPDPLDRWSRLAIGQVAQQFAARVVMPNDRPFAPFQQWAMRAEALRPSPLGILMHPRYGLWHAYRGAMLFDVEILIHRDENPIHPCDACIGKPCMNSCPVDAHSLHGFAYRTCIAHVRSQAGRQCIDDGCRARNACPVGRKHAYPPEVQAFHQQAFAGP